MTDHDESFYDSPELLTLAITAARGAGADLLARRRDLLTVDYKSSATDPVSEADRAAERLLVECILGDRPDDAILGEESGARSGTSGLRWILDPLDGTVNYLYGFATWCVSVACEGPDGTALVGAVYDPVHDELFSAARGAGAWLGDRRLAVNDPVALPDALIATGFAYAADDRRRQAAMVARLLPQVRDIRRGGSAALDLCWTAAGRVDGYLEDTTAHWDWAAGALIAAEAGAHVRRFGNGTLTAGPALYPALVAAAEAAGLSQTSV